MWYQSTQPYYNPPSPTRRGIEDADLHAHSPCRKARPALTDDKTEETEPPAKYLELMPPPPLPRRDQVAMNQGWRSRGPTPDPFIDPHFTSPRYVQIRASSDSSNDQLMPDYSRSITPASSVSSLVRNNRDPMHNAMYEEIIQGFNNNRRDLNSANSGLAPPANTRVSSTVNIPLTVETKSTTTRTRGVSGTYAREPGLVVTTTDDQTPTSENYLRVLEDRNSPDTGEGAPVRISPQPMSEVKSRKMARRASIISLREEDKENVDRGSTKVELIDGKRKRSSTIIGPKTAKPPSRKSSKVDTKDSIETGVLTEASVQQNAVQHAVLAEALNLPETN
ncbi:MAG: hypothetical protein MMC33_000241 [Icmadophila ericetorum]|nr:hypothetical protein [Icmadophila ericetorum]